MAGDPISDALARVEQRHTGGTREGRWPFARFVQEAWPIITPDQPYEGNWYHQELCAWCEALIDATEPRQLHCGPSRSGKSTIVSKLLQPWAWTFLPWLQFLTTSHSFDNVIADSGHSRMVVESDWYQSRWPITLREDQNTKDFWANTRGGHRQVAVPGGKTTGKGGHVIIGDDLLDAEERYSPTKVRKATSYWRSTAGSRLNDPRTPRLLLTGQRLALDDPPAEMAKLGIYAHLIRSQEYDPEILAKYPQGRTPIIPSMDPRTVPGEGMWPERYDEAARENLKSQLGPFAWAAMHQQWPTTEAGGVIAESDFREWSMPDGQRDPTPEAVLRYLVPDAVQLHVDGRFKADPTSGSFVIILAVARKGNNAYAIGMFRQRVGLHDTLNNLKRMVDEFRPSLTVVEKKASGDMILELLASEVPGLIGYTPPDSKRARLEAQSGILKGGRFFIPSSSTYEWSETLKAETVAFPFGSNDDIPDMISQSLHHLFPTARRHGYRDALVKNWK